MNGGYVAITDNAEPMNVVVYRTASAACGAARGARSARYRSSAGRPSATENSLLTAGRSLIVENNYGYQDPFGPNTGAVTEPGFARVDIKPDGSGCRKVWTNRDARAPTRRAEAVDQDRADLRLHPPARPERLPGLLLDRDRLPQRQDGLEQYAGSGLLYNNNYAGLALGPDGTAYLGVIGGMTRPARRQLSTASRVATIRDLPETTGGTREARKPGAGGARRPRVRARLRAGFFVAGRSSDRET